MSTRGARRCGERGWVRLRVAPFQEVLTLDGDLSRVHDPAAIKDGQTYYVFCTGGRAGQGIIPIRTSTNLRTWKTSGFVFAVLPEWVGREIPQARNAWVPDVSHYNGRFHLDYDDGMGRRLAACRRAQVVPPSAGQAHAIVRPPSTTIVCPVM